jgi:hypothetical protein
LAENTSESFFIVSDSKEFESPYFVFISSKTELLDFKLL